MDLSENMIPLNPLVNHNFIKSTFLGVYTIFRQTHIYLIPKALKILESVVRFVRKKFCFHEMPRKKERHLDDKQIRANTGFLILD